MLPGASISSTNSSLSSVKGLQTSRCRTTALPDHCFSSRGEPLQHAEISDQRLGGARVLDLDGPWRAVGGIRDMGKSVCTGSDIATLTSAGKDSAAPEAYQGTGQICDSFYRLGQAKVPTVAAVRGVHWAPAGTYCWRPIYGQLRTMPRC